MVTDRSSATAVIQHGGYTQDMPTKRMFDLAVLVVLLTSPVMGLAKMWATRVSADPNAGNVSRIAAGATRIAT